MKRLFKSLVFLIPAMFAGPAGVGQLHAEKVLFLPFCAASSSVQSERMNRLHVLFHQAAGKYAMMSGQGAVLDESDVDCSPEARQVRALIMGSDRFVQGSYRIGRDSVHLSVAVIQTRFVDRRRNEFTGKAEMQQIDSLIANALLFVLTEAELKYTDTARSAIFRLIREDGSRYTGTALSSGATSKAYIGIAAYRTGNYADAALFLAEASPDDELYGEAMYCLAKICIGKNDYSTAIGYVRNALSVGYQDLLMQEYLIQCNLLNRPADWFDTEAKRREWWNKLEPGEVGLIIRLMNNLAINGRTFDETYTYRDDDIRTLFNTTVLSLKNLRLENLAVFRHFTRTDMMVLDHTRLKSDEGLQYFSALKIVRADEKPKTPGFMQLVSSGRVAVLLSRP